MSIEIWAIQPVSSWGACRTSDIVDNLVEISEMSVISETSELLVGKIVDNSHVALSTYNFSEETDGIGIHR